MGSSYAAAGSGTGDEVNAGENVTSEGTGKKERVRGKGEWGRGRLRAGARRLLQTFRMKSGKRQ